MELEQTPRHGQRIELPAGCCSAPCARDASSGSVAVRSPRVGRRRGLFVARTPPQLQKMFRYCSDETAQTPRIPLDQAGFRGTATGIRTRVSGPMCEGRAGRTLEPFENPIELGEPAARDEIPYTRSQPTAGSSSRDSRM